MGSLYLVVNAIVRSRNPFNRRKFITKRNTYLCHFASSSTVDNAPPTTRVVVTLDLGWFIRSRSIAGICFNLVHFFSSHSKLHFDPTTPVWGTKLSGFMAEEWITVGSGRDPQRSFVSNRRHHSRWTLLTFDAVMFMVVAEGYGKDQTISRLHHSRWETLGVYVCVKGGRE